MIAATTSQITNSAGRRIPTEVNGREVIPYMGVDSYHRKGPIHARHISNIQDFPKSGDKRASSLRDALIRAGAKSSMTISTHHHLRNGDKVANLVFNELASLGLKDLVWFPSAAFPCHDELISHLDNGLIDRIEGSLNGALGVYASSGRMRGTAVLRSHGGRYRAIQDGDVQINIAVIAAPCADMFGNCNGVHGSSACGGLGFAFADAQFADHVIVVTDNLVDFPALPIQIHGNWVDQVVVVDSIGDSSQILSGTTQLTRSPERLLIADLAARFVRDSRILRNGFSFQAGAGGISLAFTHFIDKMMMEQDVRASFVRGGSCEKLVSMLEQGRCRCILDGQTFDLEGVRSMRDNPSHVMTTPMMSYNYHGKGNFASILDCVVLGATEVDLHFNANVATHSDGMMLHGLGGWQDALYSKCTILTVPTFRNRIPIIRESVTTLCGPGELVDVVVTERGIAINPARTDLIESVKGLDLPIKTLEHLMSNAHALCGGPPTEQETSNKVVGIVEWVDGTVLDSIYQSPNDMHSVSRDEGN